MLLRRILVALGLQSLECIDETRARIAGVDNVVEKATARGDIGVRELLAILFDLRFRRTLGVAAVRDLLAEKNLDRPLWAHHSDLRCWPGDVVVAANVLGGHDVVRASVCLAR